jgi:FkbM family methyltransferase
MSKIYFDVGANNGDSCIHYAQKDPNCIVYAFEPTPRMIDIIKSKTRNLSNYHIVPKAVADYNGNATFYIAGQADWGCSSLNVFNDNLDKTWPGRKDFRVTDSITVEVIRLDRFIEENKISSIEYLHCDVQGKDLEVLFGLGKYIDILKAGVIEMPAKHDTKLYKDQKYLVDDAVKFLEANNFAITKKTSNDIHNNEFNIFFSKR